MRVYFNMPTAEFVQQLRDIAIQAKARPQIIDALDALNTSDKDVEIEKVGKELAEMEEERDALLQELAALCGAVERCVESDPSIVSENLQAAIKWANKAIERYA